MGPNNVAYLEIGTSGSPGGAAMRLSNEVRYPGVLGPWEGGVMRCVSGPAGVFVAATVRSTGWGTRLCSGPETGAEGRRLADKALLAEGFRWTKVLRITKVRREFAEAGFGFFVWCAPIRHCPVWILRWSSRAGGYQRRAIVGWQEFRVEKTCRRLMVLGRGR